MRGVSPTDAIETYFAGYFQNWNISLPPDAVKARKPGHIFERGWHIGYVWGAEDGEEYLEVLAQHRMTDDRHFRVFASGRVEDLPGAATFYSYGPDATDEEKAQAEQSASSTTDTSTPSCATSGSYPQSERTYPRTRSTSTSAPAARSIATSDRLRGAFDRDPHKDLSGLC
jgi:hypothetical protein